jgi:phosphoribosyl-AMP cyclohydrolase
MIKLDFNKTGGLVPAIVQDYQTGEILMLAYMNPDAFNATLSTGIKQAGSFPQSLRITKPVRF